MALECVWDKAQVSGCFPSIRTLLMDYPSLPSMPQEGRHYGNPEEVCACGNLFIGSGLNACFQTVIYKNLIVVTDCLAGS